MYTDFIVYIPGEGIGGRKTLIASTPFLVSRSTAHARVENPVLVETSSGRGYNEDG